MALRGVDRGLSCSFVRGMYHDFLENESPKKALSLLV